MMMYVKAALQIPTHQLEAVHAFVAVAILKVALVIP
jgi:hypothetical protein